MITRNSVLTCPECGNKATPIHRNPLGEMSNIEVMYPQLAIAGEIARLAIGTLHCEKCNHQFTDAIYKTASRATLRAAEDMGQNVKKGALKIKQSTAAASAALRGQAHQSSESVKRLRDQATLKIRARIPNRKVDPSLPSPPDHEKPQG